jgi:hydrogenase maturation protease
MCSTSNLSKIAIIVLGNTFRRDDGIGIRLLEILRGRFPGADFQFLDFGIASLGLVSTLREFDRALLIDAIDAGLEPGTLKIFRFSEAQVILRDKLMSSHELSLMDLIGFCEALEVPTDVFIAGIQVKDVDYGEEMSPELVRAQSRLAEEISAFLAPWLNPAK